jgi:O-antigen ligase
MNPSIASVQPAIEPVGASDRLVRNGLFVVTFLLIWVSLTPFSDLSIDQIETANVGNLISQASALGLTAALAVFVACHQPTMLRKAVTPILVLTLGWFMLSAVVSNHPEIAVRRVVLAALTIFQASVFLLVPPSREDFARMLGICTLVVLVACYVGVAVVPSLAIHQFGDVREPELAGSWRGVYAHKNGAGSAMAVMICFGLFVRQVWSRPIGLLIIVAAAFFLVMTGAKSPLQLLPVVLVIAWLAARVQHPLALVPLLLAAPALICVLTIGSVTSDTILGLLDHVISDSSFTGRDVIWNFAMEYTGRRPWFGYGFHAFWGTNELLEGWTPHESWGFKATDAHNGYLNLSVMTGVIGLALALCWIVVQPLVDYVRCRAKGGDPVLLTLFVQIWLFGLCLAGFESVFFSGGSALWFMIVASIMGLRFQQAFALRR